jgi:hypothetical protein
MEAVLALVGVLGLITVLSIRWAIKSRGDAAEAKAQLKVIENDRNREKEAEAILDAGGGPVGTTLIDALRERLQRGADGS